MLSFSEFHSWLNIRPIEILFILLGWLIFSLLFVLRFDFHFYSLSWFHLFLPVFIMDGIHFYFVLVILLRIWLEHKQRIGLSSAYAFRLILQKIFIYLPLIACSIAFHYFLFIALMARPTSAIQVFVQCLVPLYLLIGWMFLKIFICKKLDHTTTVVVQSWCLMMNKLTMKWMSDLDRCSCCLSYDSYLSQHRDRSNRKNVENDPSAISSNQRFVRYLCTVNSDLDFRSCVAVWMVKLFWRLKKSNASRLTLTDELMSMVHLSSIFND